MHENRETSGTSQSYPERDRSEKAKSRNADRHVPEESDHAVVCAEQRVAQEGSSPSGARMRSAISKGGGNASLAGGGVASGGQGVHCEVESEGHEEKYRAVIDGGYPEDELVGQRWGTVEPALWRRRRSHSPTAPRCLQTARYGRAAGDLRRTGSVSGRRRSK
jgi:hypothetical protein